MHFTHQTKVNDDMEFQYYKNFLKNLINKIARFATTCPLQLNGWKDMGLATQ
jgi:hypothetical protein